jgi:predicted ATP-grasp superfamily ATP-dependent carboligase
LLTGVQQITPVSWRITLCKLRCSRVPTGSVRLVTGGVRVSFLGLSKQFTAIIKSLIGVIGSFGASDHVRRERPREFAVVEERLTGILGLTEVGSVLELWEV